MEKDRLYILWTNADPVTSRLMVMMYAKNALKNGWWDKITVIVWGAPVKLLAENSELQEECRLAQRMGVRFEGCITCAGELDLVKEMEDLGIVLRKWGPPLTQIIKEGGYLITV